MQITLIAYPHPQIPGGWEARARTAPCDPEYQACWGVGVSPDEARGHLLRELLLAGLDEVPVRLDIQTQEGESP